MKTPDAPPRALRALPPIGSSRPTAGKASSIVSFKLNTDVSTPAEGFSPPIRWTPSTRRNTTFEFQFHKP